MRRSSVWPSPLRSRRKNLRFGGEHRAVAPGAAAVRIIQAVGEDCGLVAAHARPHRACPCHPCRILQCGRRGGCGSILWMHEHGSETLDLRWAGHLRDHFCEFGSFPFGEVGASVALPRFAGARSGHFLLDCLDNAICRFTSGGARHDTFELVEVSRHTPAVNALLAPIEIAR